MNEYEDDDTPEPLNVYLTGEDPRYQFLVLQGSFGSRGWSVDQHTGELSRVCICSAWEVSECCCGAWDNVELGDWDD